MSFDRQEIKQVSIEESFNNIWIVYEDYEIKNGALNAKDGGNRAYAPIGYKNLPREIADLYHKKSDEAVIVFAKKYGHLGRMELFTSKQTDELIEQRMKTNKRNNNYLETLDWIYAHAKTIDICLNINYYLQENLESPLREYINQFIKNSMYYFKDTAEEEHIINERYIPIEKNSLFDEARKIRRELINRNLFGISRLLIDDEQGKDTNAFEFTSLIQVAYWIIADTIVNGRVKKCESCGKLFIQTDKRQRYCPIPDYERKNNPKRKDSRCAVRERVDNFRKASDEINYKQ